MKVIGITGGVGAGKSTVLGILNKICNCRIVMADDVAKNLMNTDALLKIAAKEIFGQQVFAADGTYNKEYLGKKMYSDPNIKAAWENVVHPATNKAIKNIIFEERDIDIHDYLFIEAALLIENGYDKICDEIWYVYADEGIRKERLLLSRGYSYEKSEHIFKNQMSDDAYRKYCSFVIDTGCSIEETTQNLKNKLEVY